MGTKLKASRQQLYSEGPLSLTRAPRPRQLPATTCWLRRYHGALLMAFWYFCFAPTKCSSGAPSTVWKVFGLSVCFPVVNWSDCETLGCKLDDKLQWLLRVPVT